jgi:hypothetical protein
MSTKAIPIDHRTARNPSGRFARHVGYGGHDRSVPVADARGSACDEAELCDLVRGSRVELVG